MDRSVTALTFVSSYCCPRINGRSQLLVVRFRKGLAGRPGWLGFLFHFILSVFFGVGGAEVFLLWLCARAGWSQTLGMPRQLGLTPAPRLPAPASGATARSCQSEVFRLEGGGGGRPESSSRWKRIHSQSQGEREDDAGRLGEHDEARLALSWNAGLLPAHDLDVPSPLVRQLL